MLIVITYIYLIPPHDIAEVYTFCDMHSSFDYISRTSFQFPCPASIACFPDPLYSNIWQTFLFFFRLVSTLINSIYFGKIYSSKKQYSTDGNDQKCCYLLVRLFFKDFYFILDCKFAIACRFVVSLIRITHSLTYFHIFVTTFVHRFF